MFRIVLMCLVISLSDANKKLLSDNLENVNIDITELWGRFPLNLMKNGTQISQKCRVAYDHYLEGLNNFNLDDLKMWDSTGKLPSGILSGNINQFGDFDECMGLKNGKYCLADIDIKPAMKGVFASYKGYVHSFFPIKDTLNDSNHRTPGFSMIKWGFCIPKDCSNVDLEKSLQEHLGFEAKVKSNMCQVGSPIKSKASIGLQITRWYFAILLVLVVTASIMHSKLQNSKNIFSKILFCFAFQRNFESLTTVKDEKEEFSSIHGFRALSAIALLGTHKSMALLFNPYINRVKLAEVIFLYSIFCFILNTIL
ncbi:unnamed protein product [Brassicogethes aeneus]|uniref:Nose resistant-to-fluoxetine protein N-terminal domain-containing protein n=1 Tax=Brassicogethes aeneus TaxID=1431903 RepID=A0A9P0FL03_BRAAE|nr:unnamed protein product [Brassicogethes aeneus]